MKKPAEDKRTEQAVHYQKPAMKTVVTPKEVRDIEQPCAFYGCGLERKKKR
jgi:hypothetical protein